MKVPKLYTTILAKVLTHRLIACSLYENRAYEGEVMEYDENDQLFHDYWQNLEMRWQEKYKVNPAATRIIK